MGTVGTPVVVSEGLVTTDEAKEYLSVTEKENIDVLLADRIAAVTRYVQEKCGRVFSLSEGVDKKVWPNAKGSLYVVDLLSAPAPVIYQDGGSRTFATLVAADTYEFLPYPENESLDADQIRYQEVALLDRWGGWDRAYPLKITDANWGYVDEDGRAPEDVRIAALMFIARFWKRKEAPLMVAQMPAIGFRRLLDDDVDANRLLEPYIHVRKRRPWQ